MFPLDKRALFLSLMGFTITVFLLVSQHLNIINLQDENELDIIYTPSHLNGADTRFDDQVKLHTSVQLARNGVITGKLGSSDYRDKLYPNVLQESAIALLYAPIIAITGNVDSPYYALSVLVGFVYLMSFYLVRSIGVDLTCAFALPFIMIFGFFYISFGNYFILPNGLMHPEDLLTATSRIEKFAYSRQYELNAFYRIHSLGGSYFFFLGYIYFLHKCLKGSLSSRQYMLPMAFALALQFYCYVFYSIAAGMSFLGVVIWLYINSIFKRDSNNLKLQATYMLCSGIIAFILALPSLIDTAGIVLLQENTDWMARLSSGTTDAVPFWGNNILLGLLLLAVLVGHNTQIRTIQISLLIVVYLVENSGLLFGVEMQPGHIYMRTVMPVAVLNAGCMLYFGVRKVSNKKYQVVLNLYRALVIAIASFSVIVAYKYSFTYAEITYKYQGISPSQYRLHEWLKERPESVVATLSPEIAVPLKFQSPSYLYLPFSGHQYTTVTNDHIDSRLVNLFWLFDANLEQLKAYFSQDKGRQFDKRYHYYYWQRRFGFPTYDHRLIEHLDILNKMISNYDLLADSSLCKSHFDYLVVDTENMRQAIFEEPNQLYLDEVVKFENIVVYKLLLERVGCEDK